MLKMPSLIKTDTNEVPMDAQCEDEDYYKCNFDIDSQAVGYLQARTFSLVELSHGGSGRNTMF